MISKMPTWLFRLILVLVILSWVPLAIIVKARLGTSDKPRIHLIQDMDNQPKFRAQAANPLFADGRAMRLPPEGALEFEAPDPLSPVESGKVGEDWVEVNPLKVDLELLQRGRRRFDIYCAPCHGYSGYGDGMVARRALALAEGTWVPPASFHSKTLREKTDGELFHTFSFGVKQMPAYGPQIPTDDRWAIVAYLRALQRSQNSPIDVVPDEELARLERGGQ